MIFNRCLVYEEMDLHRFKFRKRWVYAWIFNIILSVYMIIDACVFHPAS